MPSTPTAAIPIDLLWQRPGDTELDLFGLTHPGRVRKENQDHFMVCTVHPQVVVHGTSLPDVDQLPLRGSRLATYMLVADGVGSGSGGGEASRLALGAVMQYVTTSLRSYHSAGSASDQEFYDAMTAAAMEAHAKVLAESASQPEAKMATTLTLAVAVFPWMYVTQVGDSRCYRYWDGDLVQMTRDQTVAQGLVDQGILPAERAANSPFSHVLSSAVGGGEATPVVNRIEIPRGCVILLCTDGLTKHVSDIRIAERLQRLESSEQAARALVNDALEAGGSDNVTALVLRAIVRPEGT